MDLKTLKKLIKKINGRTSIYVQGRPGSGKTSVIEEIASELDWYFPLNLGQMDSMDVKGLPMINLKKGKTALSRPYYFPDPEDFPDKEYDDITGILFLDEIDHANSVTISACYQLLLEKRVGNYRLPKNVMVICASNRKSDGGLHFSMPKPVLNRLIVVDASASVEEWLAKSRGLISPLITAFIAKKPEMLYCSNDEDKKLSHYKGAFASPRSWWNANPVIQEVRNDLEIAYIETLEGTIGITAATEFNKFLLVADSTLDPDLIMVGDFSTINEKDLTNTEAVLFLLEQIISNTKNGKYKKSITLGLAEFILDKLEVKFRTMFYVVLSKQISTKYMTVPKKDKDHKQILNTVNKIEQSINV